MLVHPQFDPVAFSLGANEGGSEITRSNLSPRFSAASRNAKASAVTKACPVGSSPFSRKERCAEACAGPAVSTDVTRVAPPSAAAIEKPPV